MSEPSFAPVRFHKLKLMAKSPAHYRASVLGERKDSPAMRFGRLVHALALGGKALFYDGKRAGKRWIEFQRLYQGQEIYTDGERLAARRVVDALEKHGDAKWLLGGAHEVELAWLDTGRACGGRLDVITPFGVCDLKTTSSAEPGWFCRNAQRMGYHAQLAWYLDAARACGHDLNRAFIVAVEPSFPYSITTFELTPRALDLGRRLYRSWFERLLTCERSDAWPGYTEVRQEFDVDDSGLELDFDE
jgi:hypothetical protein